MNTFRPALIYAYDAYCGWCYGFSPVIKKIWATYQEKLDIEVLSGGMIPAASAQHISTIAPFIEGAYKRVEELTGVRFGEDYLWHIRNPEKSDWFPHSEKAAIALAIFREYHPADTLSFATDLQVALHEEGRDLTDDEAYRHLLGKYEIPADEFYQKLRQTEYLDKAKHDFAQVKQLQISGFPAVLMQSAETKFYLLANGYTDFDTLSARIQRVLQEIT